LFKGRGIKGLVDVRARILQDEGVGCGHGLLELRHNALSLGEGHRSIGGVGPIAFGYQVIMIVDVAMPVMGCRRKYRLNAETEEEKENTERPNN
jgi:hypothetical protein